MRWLPYAIMSWVLGCGARSGLENDTPRADAGSDTATDTRDAALDTRDAALDASTSFDFDCPREARPNGACDVEFGRLCFYGQPDRALDACRCVDGHWQCLGAVCDGWGPPCFNSVHNDRCEERGLGCGACCSLGRAAALATWCACDTTSDRPFCTTDVLCTGPLLGR